MNELSKRISVAALGIPLAAILVWAGGLAFFTVIAFISAGALNEFYNLCEKKGYHPVKTLGYILGTAFQILFYIFYSNGDVKNLFILFIAAPPLILLSALGTQVFRDKENSLASALSTAGGVFYIHFLLISLFAIREFSSLFGTFTQFTSFIAGTNTAPPNESLTGMYYVMIIFLSIWACDSGAYFAGRAFGKHKMCERVSPKKTWEGAVSGGILAIAAFVGLSAWLMPQMPIFITVINGIIIAFAGQLGDLAESQLKRDAKIKDSSNLLPGHGGLLDRFDSILFAAPLIFIVTLIYNLV